MSVSNKTLLKWLLISLFAFVCMGVFHMSAATIYAEESNEQPSQVEVQQDSETIPNESCNTDEESANDAETKPEDVETATHDSETGNESYLSKNNQVDKNVESDRIKELLMRDSSLSFDPNTQTYLAVSVDADQTEHMKSLHIYQADEHIKGHDLPFTIRINNANIGKGQIYYLVSETDDTIEKRIISDSFSLAANSGKLAVFILNKGDTYSVSSNPDDWYYTHEQDWKDENGNRYNGYEFHCRPANNELVTEFKGMAGDAAITTPFSVVWDLMNYLDVEIWMADVAKKNMDQPGWVFPEGTTGYVDFKVELRDPNGNIFLLPKTYFNNYGDINIFGHMSEDGIISIPLSHLSHSVGIETDDGSPYGEFDFYFPFGYDYRITVQSFSVDTLGGYAYCLNQEHKNDEDGFYLTNHSLVMKSGEDGEWGSWMELEFMPLNKGIRIEKQTDGDAPDDIQYTFQMSQWVPSYYMTGSHQYTRVPDLLRLVCKYPYELYDAKTGTKLHDGYLMTDNNGQFFLKANQYAIFKVWELPEDYASYEPESSWIDFIDIYKYFKSDVPKESEYIFDEVESPDCATTVIFNHAGKETIISGKHMKGVYGGDEILYLNVFDKKKVPPTNTEDQPNVDSKLMLPPTESQSVSKKDTSKVQTATSTGTIFYGNVLLIASFGLFLFKGVKKDHE